MATVHLSALLRPHAGGAASPSASGATLRQVIEDLVRQYPALAGRIIDEAGIRPEILLAVDANEAFSLDQPVGPEAEVFVQPAIAGGVRGFTPSTARDGISRG